MEENFVDNAPFVCIEVDENSTMEYLEKSFDELFPNRTIRLIINGNYSPYFYMGKGLWVYKNTGTKKQNFSFKVLLEENIFNYINDDEIDFFDYVGIDIEDFEVIGDLVFDDNSLESNYTFLSNGCVHVFQQYNMNVDYIYELFSKFLDCEIVFNSLNVLNNGMLIVQTETDILGDN
jgi:hypothetical protein